MTKRTYPVTIKDGEVKVAFKPPYPQTPVKKYDGKYMPVHNQKKV